MVARATRFVRGAGLGLALALLAAAVPAWGGPPRRAPREPADAAGYDALIPAEERAHWAFQPVEAPEVPAVGDPSWCENPVDRFVLAGLDARGWRPAPPAGPRALARRMYLDVIGLPPTPAEQEAFARDHARDPAGAAARLADDLLARPGYGERWARHWLDLVRFAESNGYERDAAKPFAWRYRDYVIRAFNEDRPFDRFVVEQLAGDELPGGAVTAETRVATTYYRLGPWDDEPADPKQDRFDQLDDIVVTTSEVFLGLTLGCARCHNHKFEPITALDYYRMVAVFDPLQRPQDGRSERTLPVGTPAEVAAEARREARLAGLRAALDEAKRAKDEATAARVALEVERVRREAPALPRAYVLWEPPGPPPVTHLLQRGQAASPGPVVGPGVPAVLVAAQPPFPGEPGAATTGRRLALARWLVGKDNPLTARVIVNRVWQWHLGAGIVRTPSDFGTNGEEPTHPELLDWLADWFVDHGWSLKALHRLILTSATYRMGTRINPPYMEEDPEDAYLWRRPYRRLDAEPIRDAMLAAAGTLDRRMYGPSMYPHVPREAIEASSDPATAWPPFDEASADRRTIYAFIKRSLVVPMLDLLDLCDSTRSAPRRNVTSVPTQALTLLNGDFVNRQARHLAARLEREAGDSDPARVDLAFRLTLCRPPTEPERAALLDFLGRAGRARHEALAQACRALFNCNEFVYPD